ncbi:MAG: cupin domain-containing protein [Acidobacteriota bacterium]|nr:cupin domain-containing protein [Acidobacteriota bacterium]
MQRYEAVSSATVGASQIWMGESVLVPGSVSGAHHHGDSETGIYVRSGHPSFVFLKEGQEVRLDASPGDYVFVPKFVAHREENHSLDEPAVVILARSTQEAIVVNVEHL